MSHPNDPTPVGTQPVVPTGQKPLSSGMAVTAFVVGLIGFLTAFIPVINAVSIVGGIVAVVLGVLAVRKANAGQAAGKGLAVAGLVLGALAVIGGIIANLLFGAAVTAIDEAVQDTEQRIADQEADRGTAVDDGAAGTETEGTASDDAATDDAATDDEATDGGAAGTETVLALGESAEVGEYTVTVTAVNLDAGDVLAEANQFNEPATNQYVLADVSVVYTGAEEGDAWLDLSHVFMGTDARQYDASACGAVTPAPVVEAPTLNNGGAADYQVCFDVPADAMDGGRIFVEESFSWDESRAYWAVQ